MSTATTQQMPTGRTLFWTKRRILFWTVTGTLFVLSFPQTWIILSPMLWGMFYVGRWIHETTGASRLVSVLFFPLILIALCIVYIVRHWKADMQD